MKRLREWVLRFGGLFNKQRKDRELDDEIESHIQMHIEDNLRLRMTPEEARRQAMIQFGGIESTKESYRDQRGLPLLDTFFHDIRFGARQLRKKPGFAAVAVLTLALGIGANTAIFSVVDAVLLRPLAYPDSGQLVSLSERGPDWSGGSLSYPNFIDWRDQQSAFEKFGVYSGNNFTLTGAGEPVRLAGAMMSADVFAALRTRPESGRVFREDEDKPGAAPVAVISRALWQNRFGGQAGIVNKTINLNGKPYTILGVMPAGFEFPNKVDLWLPVGPFFAESSWQKQDNHPGLWGLARLKPGVTLEQARGDLDVIALRLEQQYPESNKTRRVQIDKLLDNKVGNVRRALWILLGAVSFVLVIACANVANLLLARAALKDREPISIRAVTPDYFATLGMRIVAGRGVRTADAGNSAEGIPGNAPFVAVINQSLANVCFPGRDPLGKRLRLSWRPEQPEVVGVVSNTRTDNLTQQARSELCFSMWQSPAWVAHLV